MLQSIGVDDCAQSLRELLSKQQKGTGALTALTVAQALWRGGNRSFARRVLKRAIVGKLVRKLVEAKHSEAAYEFIMEVESSRSLHLSPKCYAAVILSMTRLSKGGRKRRKLALAAVRLYRHVDFHLFAVVSPFENGGAAAGEAGEGLAPVPRGEPSLYTAGMAAYAAAGRLEDAKEVIATMTSRGVLANVECFNTIMEFSTELSRRRDKGTSASARVARGRLLATMPRYGVRPDATTYSHLCTLIMEDDMLQSAEAVRRAACRLGVGLTESGWSSLAEGFARRGYDRHALQLIGEMRGRGVQPSWRTAEVQVACLVVQGRSPDAHAFRQPSNTTPRRPRPWKLATDILRHRMIVLSLEGNTSEALNVYSESLRLGFEINVATRQVLVQSLARHGSTIEMLRIFSELRQSARETPSLATYTSVVSRLSKAKGRSGTVRNALENAEMLWNEARDVHSGALDTAFFNSGLYMFAKRGDIQSVESLLRAMGSSNVRRDDLTHHCMIICYANSRSPKKLTKVLRQMESSGCRPSVKTFDLLVAAYSRLDRVTQAHETISTARRAGCCISIEGWIPLIRAYTERGDVAGAESVTRTMTGTGIEPNARVCGMLIKGEIVRGDLDAARRRFDEMLGQSVSPTVSEWNVLLGGYRDAGMVDEAWDMLLGMRAAGVSPSRKTYTTIMSMIAESETPMRVLSIYDIAKKDGFPPDAATYSILIKAYSRAARFRDVRDTFHEALLDTSVFPDIQLFNSYLSSMVRAGQYSQAESVYTSILEKSLQPSYGTFVPLMRARSRRGDVDGVFELYDAAIVLADSSAVSPPLKLFELMVDICAKLRRWVDLTRVLRAMEVHGYRETKEKYEEILKSFLLKNPEIGGVAVDHNVDAFEWLKWWLGLPSTHYKSDRDDGSEWQWWN